MEVECENSNVEHGKLDVELENFHVE